ncbi:hypothetical protein GF376_00200 [Candidatus Peregrinibacteria bacterium]|nr:hypothetical protein [Candidatus Peregrinibacteria bacterium]
MLIILSGNYIKKSAKGQSTHEASNLLTGKREPNPDIKKDPFIFQGSFFDLEFLI